MATHSKTGSQATTVEVAARTFALPADCPCCGATPDTEMTVPLSRRARDRAAADSARSIEVPYCRQCAAHTAAWDSAGVLSSGLIVIGLGAGAAVIVASSTVLGLAVIGAGVAIALAVAATRRTQAKHGCRESCSSPHLAVAYLGWTGTSTGFSFESIAYAAKFAEQNQPKLVEDPRVRTLLDRYKLARIAVPTPAAAVQAIPPPPDAAEWMARLAAMPGRVARRASLSRALEVLTEPRERQQVVRAVAAIELATLMSPIERLHGPARERALRAAQAHVRADNLPDELREVLLRDLEAKSHA
jgi:hypothetical protein